MKITKLNKTRKIIIWGSSGHAKVLIDALEARIVPIALFDNNKKAKSVKAGVPIFYTAEGFKKWEKSLKGAQEILFTVAIGGDKGLERERISNFISSYDKFKETNIVHNSACVAHSAKLGLGIHILANTVVSSCVRIGNFGIINNLASVDHDCVLGTGVHIGPGAVLAGCVTVDDYSFVGAGAVILPRIRIGKNCIIGAGAVVTKDVKNNTIVIGNPAKPHKGRP